MIFRYQRRKIIIGNHWQSLGNHWQSLAIFGNHRQSLAIFGQSLAIKPIWAIKNSAFSPLVLDSNGIHLNFYRLQVHRVFQI